VLVNPTELPLDVPMETPFRRILGVYATGVNNGAVSSTMHIPGGDALFLLRAQIDNVRPAAVNDLRVGP
jgi:NADH:ubiquinone oxidoreductase subunit F (NADH-binding)